MRLIDQSQTADRSLHVIDALSDNSPDLLRDQIHSGANFLLLMRDDPLVSKNFCNLFHLELDSIPKRLSPRTILHLRSFLAFGVLETLVTALKSGKIVLFVDQLDLPLNRPPALQPFIIYSPIRGIISQHPVLAEAREALQFEREDLYIHHWTGAEWRAI